MRWLVLGPDATDAELRDAITELCHAAKRCVPKVGTDQYPTPWDLTHARINAVLDDLDRVTDGAAGLR